MENMMRPNRAEDLEKINALSLKILSEIGVEFLSERVCEIFKRSGKVSLSGNKVFFPEETVSQALVSLPETFRMEGYNGDYAVTVGGASRLCLPGYGAPFVVDSESNRKPGTMEDYIRIARMVHQSDIFAFNGGILVQPSDIPVETSAIAMTYAALRTSDKCCFIPSATSAEIPYVHKMLDAVFGDQESCGSARGTTIVNSNPPLQYDRRMLDNLIALAERGQPAIISPGCSAGLTAPVSLYGALAMGNAEFLAAMVLSQLIRKGTPVVYGLASTVGDMRMGAQGSGSVEHSLLCKFSIEMAKRYGVPSRVHGSMPDASEPLCVQGGYESMMGNLLSHLNGASILIHSAGLFDCSNAFSFEKFVVDEEVIRQIRYYVRQEIPCEDDDILLEHMKDVGHGEFYLVKEYTLENFRNNLLGSKVFLRGVKQEAYSRQFEKNVGKRISSMLSRYRAPEMSDAKRDALRRIALDGGVLQSDLDRIDSLLA